MAPTDVTATAASAATFVDSNATTNSTATAASAAIPEPTADAINNSTDSTATTVSATIAAGAIAAIRRSSKFLNGRVIKRQPRTQSVPRTQGEVADRRQQAIFNYVQQQLPIWQKQYFSADFWLNHNLFLGPKSTSFDSSIPATADHSYSNQMAKSKYNINMVDWSCHVPLQLETMRLVNIKHLLYQSLEDLDLSKAMTILTSKHLRQLLLDNLNKRKEKNDNNNNDDNDDDLVELQDDVVGSIFHILVKTGSVDMMQLYMEEVVMYEFESKELALTAHDISGKNCLDICTEFQNVLMYEYLEKLCHDFKVVDSTQPRRPTIEVENCLCAYWPKFREAMTLMRDDDDIESGNNISTIRLALMFERSTTCSNCNPAKKPLTKDIGRTFHNLVHTFKEHQVVPKSLKVDDCGFSINNHQKTIKQKLMCEDVKKILEDIKEQYYHIKQTRLSEADIAEMTEGRLHLLPVTFVKLARKANITKGKFRSYYHMLFNYGLTTLDYKLLNNLIKIFPIEAAKYFHLYFFKMMQSLEFYKFVFAFTDTIQCQSYIFKHMEMHTQNLTLLLRLLFFKILKHNDYHKIHTKIQLSQLIQMIPKGDLCLITLPNGSVIAPLTYLIEKVVHPVCITYFEIITDLCEKHLILDINIAYEMIKRQAYNCVGYLELADLFFFYCKNNLKYPAAFVSNSATEEYYDRRCMRLQNKLYNMQLSVYILDDDDDNDDTNVARTDKVNVLFNNVPSDYTSTVAIKYDNVFNMRKFVNNASDVDCLYHFFEDVICVDD